MGHHVPSSINQRRWRVLPYQHGRFAFLSRLLEAVSAPRLVVATSTALSRTQPPDASQGMQCMRSGKSQMLLHPPMWPLYAASHSL